MLLGTNCRYCNIELTIDNSRKRKHIKSGFRKECKICRNKKERSKTKQKRCEYCNKLCITKGIRSFCSMFCRFSSYYTIKSSGCWEWRPLWVRKGYGQFTIGKKVFGAHRVSYEMFKGPIPENMFVCHACDNPSCVNPDHLWVGTNAENQQDRFLKKFTV